MDETIIYPNRIGVSVGVGRSTVEDDELEVPPWSRRRRVLDDLRRCFGPVGE